MRNLARVVTALLPAVVAACSTSKDTPVRGAAGTDSVSRAASPATSSAATVNPDTTASAGDTVWVVLNRVKASRRADFQRFLETFRAGGLRLGASDRATLAAFRRTRVLVPAAPDSDGTYPYFFLMDPALHGVSYDIDPYLKRMLPAPQADSVSKVFSGALVGGQRGWTVTQSAHGGRQAASTSGDSVWIILNVVRADQRPSFERFVETFWMKGRELGQRDSAVLRTFSQTRVLYPTKPDSAGTYTYVYIMDPVVPGQNYDIGTALRQMYGPRQADSVERAYEQAVVSARSRLYRLVVMQEVDSSVKSR